MKSVLNLMDFDKVDALLEGFNKSTGFVTAILDLEGNVLSKSGWRQMCTQFHRIHPETSKMCTISDTALASKMADGEKYHFYTCLNGLVDVAVPIVINGDHLANLFSGQFFFEEPDISFFKKQAEKYGFDKEKYLEALSKVPVVSKEKVKTVMDFLLDMTRMISDLAFQKVKQVELNKQIIEAKERAEESEKRFRSLIENAPDGVVILDDRGKYTYVSPNAERLFGYNKDEAIGHSGDENTHPDDLPLVLKTLETILANPGQKPKLEYRFKRKNGEFRWIETTFTNLLSDKAINGIVLNFSDITARKQIFEELLITKENAEESDRLKSAFLANMSHEIRTPMNGILGFAGLLKEPKLSGEQQQKYIQLIEKSGARMLNIINDIVSISKIESGLMDVHLSEMDIHSQFQFVYDMLKLDAEHKNLTLSFHCGFTGKEAIIQTDGEKLYGILSNLVKNAIKYTDSGTIEFGYNKIETHGGATLQFYVKDTGIGIPKDRQEAIFERFIQADMADKMARQGAGLGLAISKAYIDMLGGKIWVESEEGKGSTFYFTLPYQADPAPEIIDRQPEPSEQPDAVNKLKILMVEDDEVSEMLLDETVKLLAKETLKARTGVEAVEACRNNPDIDLILMDIQIPEMDGYKATKLIREFNKEVIIIAQTAYGLTGDREKSIEAGCTDYLAKPIGQVELRTKIAHYFGHRT